MDDDNTLAGGMAEQLCAYVRRVRLIEEEVAKLQGEKSELYREAKACGFDAATIKALAYRRDIDDNLQTYRKILAASEADAG